jgi:hypothetical protein
MSSAGRQGTRGAGGSGSRGAVEAGRAGICPSGHMGDSPPRKHCSPFVRSLNSPSRRTSLGWFPGFIPGRERVRASPRLRRRPRIADPAAAARAAGVGSRSGRRRRSRSSAGGAAVRQRARAQARHPAGPALRGGVRAQRRSACRGDRTARTRRPGRSDRARADRVFAAHRTDARTTRHVLRRRERPDLARAVARALGHAPRRRVARGALDRGRGRRLHALRHLRDRADAGRRAQVDARVRDRRGRARVRPARAAVALGAAGDVARSIDAIGRHHGRRVRGAARNRRARALRRRRRTAA